MYLWFKNFVRFSRLHTIIGTVLSVSVLFLIALSVTGSKAYIPSSLWFYTVIACLGANIYIVGLNQLTDIEIDKINKPYLPLASGAFSVRTGWILVLMGLFLSLLLAYAGGKYLLLTVLISLVLGTAYSLPPFRLKRFHFWAAFCIIAIRGLVVNIFLYLHFQYSLNGVSTLPTAILWLTLAMFGYSLVIAWYKDIPDMKGDAAYHIQTMTMKLGAERVLLIGNSLLSVILLSLTILPFVWTVPLHPVLMMVSHILMLLLLWVRSRKVDPMVHADIRSYYLFIWTLFFLEYISFALAAWYF